MFKKFTIILIAIIICLLDVTHCASDKNNYNENNNENNNENSILNNISWECANNATCVKILTENFIKNYDNGNQINFGLFSIEKLEQQQQQQSELSETRKFINSGRSGSSLVSFLQGNVIKFPIGPMVFSISRAENDDDYIEVALLKKSTSEGRRHRNRQGHRDKKQLQMFIPMYLAATTFGWTMLAVKAAGALTVKALLVSKLAFLVAIAIIIKKVMDSATEKMYHQPYMMPYHMDYGIHSHAMSSAEINPNEFYNLHLNHHAPAAASALENMAAESSVAHAFEIQANATQPQLLAALAAANAAAAVNSQKIKRNDRWNAGGVKPPPANPLVYSYVPSNNQPIYVYRK